MNIVFYVEPLIEKNDPYWKTGWLTYCCGNIIKTLNRSNVKFEYLIALSEPLAGVKVDFDFTKVVFSQEELLAPFGKDYLQATVAWYKEYYSTEQLAYYVELMRKRMEGFQPDIIITFSPAPFFRDAFPSALLLYHEYSIFSRSPYPESWFLDPCGMSESSFLNRYKDKATAELNSNQKSLVTKFKETCARVIDQTSPFKEIMNIERGKFKHLVLLPLQDSSYYSFDGIVSYRSQYDFLVDILEIVPDDVGVVVTMHPDSPAIKPSAFDFLRKKYKNCIYYPQFAAYNGISQYLVKETDAVLTVSSTVGLQTAFFDRKLVTLGKTFSYFTECNSLQDLPSYLSGPDPDNDATLHWIITRYAVQKQDFLDPQWLSSFLLRATAYYRDRKAIDYDFYDAIKDEEAAYDGLIAYMTGQLPALPEFVRAAPTPYAHLYCDAGRGFEHSPLKVVTTRDSSPTCLTFSPIPPAPMQALRLVPLTDYVIFELLELQATTPCGIVPLTPSKSNAASREGNIFYFDTKGPSIEFGFNSCEILKVVIKARYLAVGQDALARIVDLEKAERIKQDNCAKQLSAEIKVLDEQNEQLNFQIHNLNEQCTALNQQNQELSGSVRQLNADIETREHKVNELQSAYNALQEMVTEQDRKVAQLEISAQEKSKTILQLTEGVETREQKVNELQSAVDALQDLVTERDRTVAQLEISVLEKNKQFEQLNEAIETREHKINELQTACDALELELADRSALQAKLEVRLQQRDDAVVALEKRTEELQAAIGASEETRTALATSLEQAIAQLASSRQIRTDLEAALRSKCVETSDLEQRLRQVEEAMLLEQERVAEFVALHERSVGSAEQLRGTLEECLQQQSVRIQEHEQRNRQAIEELARQSALAEEHLAAKEESITNLSEMLEQAGYRLKAAEDELVQVKRAQQEQKAGYESLLQEREQRVQDLQNSLSWKVTGPLRKAYDLVRGR